MIISDNLPKPLEIIRQYKQNPQDASNFTESIDCENNKNPTVYVLTDCLWRITDEYMKNRQRHGNNSASDVSTYVNSTGSVFIGSASVLPPSKV